MERELAISEAELWETFDTTLLVLPMDEDEPGFKTTAELAKHYNCSPSVIRKAVKAAFEAGTLDRRRVRRTIGTRQRVAVWVYRPKPSDDASRETRGTRGG